jgi:hypothetical protein
MNWSAARASIGSRMTKGTQRMTLESNDPNARLSRRIWRAHIVGLGLALAISAGCGEHRPSAEPASLEPTTTATEPAQPAEPFRASGNANQGKPNTATASQQEPRPAQGGAPGPRQNPPQPGGGPVPGANEIVTSEMIKTRIKATDEEWKVIGPKLRKLQEARRATELSAGNGGLGGMGGGRGGRGPGGGNDSFGGPSNFSGGFGGPGGRGGRGPGGRGDFGGPDDFGPGGPGGFGPGDFGRRNGPPPNGEPLASGKPDGERGTRMPPAENANRGAVPGNPGRSGAANQGPGGFNLPMMGGPPPGFGGMGGPGFGGMGGPGGGDAAISKAMADLQTILADTKMTPDQLKEKVEAVRLARQKARIRLETARNDLIELLTPEQEAVLITLGYLD